MSATTKPIKDKIPAQAYLLHTICFLDTGSDTAYFPHFHCSSQVVREIIIDIISIGMSKKLIYIVPLFSNEYYGAAEPPVRCGESHLSGLTEPPHFVY